LKILIIRSGALGDTLMLMPAIRTLRKNNEILFVGRLPAIDYIRPYVDLCIDIDSSGWHRLFMQGPADLPEIPLFAPDYVIGFLNDPEGNVLCNLTVCFPGSIVRVFPVFPPEKDKRHIALYMAQAIQEAGLPMDALSAFNSSLEGSLMTSVDALFDGTGPVVIHPGSGSQKKNYPPLFWLQLIKELKKEGLDNSRRIILLLGPAEEGISSFFRDSLSETDVQLCALPEREELMSLLGNASVYIGHDSGITHLAAMLGRPVIALFKDSPEERWRPLGPKVRIIKAVDYSLSS
jgi:heptosyltransferase III